METRKLHLRVSDDGDMAYLFLPNHPGKGKSKVVERQISLQSVIENYKGPEIYLDFSSTGEVIGIEFFLD